MKPRHASVALAVLGLVVALVVGCNHPQRRNEWRAPSVGGPRPPASCTTDADCASAHGTCTLEIGATQGTCSGAPSLSPVPHVDGGSPAQPGLPNHQPSSNDIQI